MSNLKPLDKHNKEKISVFATENSELKNGLACPNCGQELFDASQFEVLLSFPAKKKVLCVCGFEGYRLV
jgi:hypothetical protein